MVVSAKQDDQIQSLRNPKGLFQSSEMFFKIHLIESRVDLDPQETKFFDFPEGFPGGQLTIWRIARNRNQFGIFLALTDEGPVGVVLYRPYADGEGP